MALQVKHTCGTCGLEIIDRQTHVDHSNVVEKKVLWHECGDGYIVPLQSEVEKAPAVEPVVKAKHEKASHK